MRKVWPRWPWSRSGRVPGPTGPDVPPVPGGFLARPRRERGELGEALQTRRAHPQSGCRSMGFSIVASGPSALANLTEIGATARWDARSRFLARYLSDRAPRPV